MKRTWSIAHAASRMEHAACRLPQRLSGEAVDTRFAIAGGVRFEVTLSVSKANSQLKSKRAKRVPVAIKVELVKATS